MASASQHGQAAEGLFDDLSTLWVARLLPGGGTMRFRKDLKAAAGLGAMLAWRGWIALIVGGFAGFLFGAVYGIALLVILLGT